LKGLIAAKLNGNPKLDELVSIYDKQILERDMYNTVEEMERLRLILPMIGTSRGRTKPMTTALPMPKIPSESPISPSLHP
jgi:hypothetical protein